ncbi:prephenate dehydrogenase [Corynebacterium sp. 3HC-13]|nr:prephenate dehydrogenase [Corynebacterium poyangense]
MPHSYPVSVVGICHTCQVINRFLTKPICILGLGLIGGSLLRDLKAAGQLAYGYNRSASGARHAASEGFDVSDDLESTLSRAETDEALIVIATPIGAVDGMLDKIKELAPSCGITDVVSVKSQVYALVRSHGLADRYVGGHPMAGTADSGWKASQEGLFQGAAWVITFDHALDTHGAVSSSWVELWYEVARMIKLTGAEIIPSRVDHHDAAVARVSHLPHLLAETLAVVGDNGGALSLSLAAGSFRDGTRVAGTAPALVQGMCETNSEALVKALDEAIELLAEARTGLTAKRPSIAELADAGYRSRIRYEARSGLGAAQQDAHVATTSVSGRPVLRLLPGAPGWVKQLIHAESLGARIEVF